MIKLKNLKDQRGFTLVEVIVVAIIVAALAGVAIPMYTSYVKSSRDNAAANAAGSLASYMGACVNQSGTVTPLTYDGSAAATITCTGTGLPQPPQIQVPKGVAITIVLPNPPAAGVVTATSTASNSATATYNF